MTKVFNFDYKGYCESIILPKGRYLLEVWGAEGGNCGHENNGGGYSNGTLILKEEERFYVCVGGQGSSSKTDPKGGFNGGGNGDIGEWNECTGGGGGATDIRKNINTSRIIIAGGSGGLYYHHDETKETIENYKGGVGGGEKGEDGIAENDSCKGKGGTDSKGGDGGKYYDINQGEAIAQAGKPFLGGEAKSGAGACPGGGGGGYYGGGGGADLSGGGGGSGYVDPFFLLNGITTTIGTGNKGNGKASITLIEPYYLTCIKRYFTININIIIISFLCDIIK